LSDLKTVWKNDYFKTAVAIIIIVAIVLGFLFGLQLALNTPNPALTVESGSMSVPYDAMESLNWEGFWLSIAHPFDRTLSVGDIIIVQGVNPKDLNANYPNSDIIVYRDPSDMSTLIVHRIVSKQEINGTWYFQTKGDGNGQQWPAIPSPDEYDGHTIWYNAQYSNTGIPQNYVIGKVIMRIPWFGWVTLFMRDNSWGLPVVIALILLLIVIEFIIPILREKKPEQQNTTQSQMSL
jgi:signal peptidase I